MAALPASSVNWSGRKIAEDETAIFGSAYRLFGFVM
jgi:hypothetical protein